MIRSYTFNELSLADTSKIVGYSCGRRFLGWQFVGLQNVFEASDALKIIKNYWSSVQTVPNIELEAVYSAYSEEIPMPNRYISVAHALGGYDGKNYVNSLEAFEYWYGAGQRFFETDITITSDGQFAASHDWTDYTLEEFLARKTQNYTPLSLQDVLEICRTHKDVYMYFDTAGIGRLQWGAVADGNYNSFYEQVDRFVSENHCQEMYDRLILEVVIRDDSDMFRLAKENSGFTNFAYSYDWSRFRVDTLADMEALCSLCADENIFYLCMADFSEEQVNIAHEKGIAAMAYTYNDPIEIYKLYDKGIDFVFTDFTMNL